MRPIFLVIVIVLVLCPTAWATRPFVTDDFWLTEKGQWYFSTGIFVDKEQNDTTGGTANSMETELDYGLSDNMDVELWFPYFMTGDNAGIGDLLFSLKWRPLGTTQEGIALRADLQLASANPPIGLGVPQYALTGILTKNFNGLYVHWNLVYKYAQPDPTIDPIQTVGYYTGFEFSAFADQMTLLGELWGESNSDFSQSPSYYLIGIRFPLTDNVLMDNALGFGANESASKMYATTGFSVTF